MRGTHDMPPAARPRRIGRVLMGVVAASAMGWWVNSIAPASPWHVGVLLATLWAAAFFLTDAVIRRPVTSAATATALTCWLALRALNLRHPVYAILVAASLVSFLAAYRRQTSMHTHEPDQP